jgi:hypothetical protein
MLTAIVKGATGPYAVALTNIQGTILWKAEEVKSSDVQLPLANLPGGIYMVIIYDKEHTGRLKLVKQ